MTEKSSNESQEKPVVIARVTQGRQPMAMSPIPAECAVDANIGTDAAPSAEERGRQPVPMTPVRPEPAQPAQSPAPPAASPPGGTSPKE
jgi:hypothetical protein